MNEYQKAIKRGIEKGLDEHFKVEPKVWLTVEEAKGILWDLRDLYKQTYGYEWVKNEPWFDEFKKRIEQAKEEK